MRGLSTTAGFRSAKNWISFELDLSTQSGVARIWGGRGPIDDERHRRRPWKAGPLARARACR